MKIKVSSAFGEDFFLVASGLATCLNKMWFFDVEVMVTYKGIKYVKFKFRQWTDKHSTLYICWCTEVLLPMHPIESHTLFLYYANWKKKWHLRPEQRAHPFKLRSCQSIRYSGIPPNKNKKENWLKMEAHDGSLFCSASPLCGNVIKRKLTCETEDFALKWFASYM